MAKKRRAPLTVPGLPYLRKYRHRAKMTQEQLAEELDVTQGMISQWENGDADILLSMVPRLAKALRTTSFELMFVDPTSQGASFYEVWNRIPASQRTQAIRILEAIATPAE